MAVRVLRRSAENLAQLKDEEYTYWQSRPPLERLLATQELSFAFFEERTMKLNLDANFCDLLRLFHACHVRYLIVGGWAVSIHAQPRATQDIDIFVSPERSNIEAVFEALVQFGAPLKKTNKGQFLEPDTFFRVGVPPRQIDIFPGIPGVQFEACWPNRVEIPLAGAGDFPANLISANDLITAKIASGRPQDLADAQAIRSAQQKKPRV